MNDKIRWGVLSTADIAQKQVIPAIQQSKNGIVTAIASRDLHKAQEVAQRLGIPSAHASYEALLQDANVDAIYNPLPVAMHAEWSIRCAEAGKATLCEKPLAANAPEARAMKKAFAKNKVLLGEAIMYHFHPLTQRAMEVVRAGTIGQIRAMRATFHVNIAKDEDIRFQKNMAGGGLLDVGSYCVSLLRLAAGEEPDALSGFNNVGQQSQVDETFQGLLHFPSGALGSFSCSLRTAFDCSYDISGSKGRLLVDLGAMCAWPNGEFKIKLWVDGADYQEIVVPPANHYISMVEDFADALLRHRALTVSLDESIRNLKVLDRLAKKAKTFVLPTV